MADEKPKVDAKPKAEEKPAEEVNFAKEIIGMLFMFFVISTLLGGVLTSATNFISGIGSGSFSIQKLIDSYSRPFKSVLNPIGGFAVVRSEKTNVYDSPNGNLIGTQKKQAMGRVVRGSVTIGGITYWYVDFETDPDGWVAEDDLGYVDPQTRAITQKEDPGTIVKTKNDSVTVFGTAGGQQIGTQGDGVYGKIVRGPESVNGVNYWYVDFDDGTDGWVKEDDLLVVEPVPMSLATRAALLLYKIGSWFRYILWVITILLVGAITYVIRGLTQVRVNNRKKLYQIPDATSESLVSINKSWDRVMMYVESYNESEWRLAVIEADIMLSELLDTMNLAGDSIGDKLKGIEKSDFTTLDLAWEAHKIRNQIAHDPSFLLSQREAKRVIGLYETVFKEFAFI